MNAKFSLPAACLLGLLGAASTVLADDTDLFLANPPGTTVPNPNVLMILDNSANWSATLGTGTKFAAEMTAINTVLNSVGSNINLGLELFGETGGGNSNPVTSYIRYAVRPMTATNRAGLQSLFSGLGITADKGSNAPYGFSLFEAWKYFGGSAASPHNATHYGPVAFGGFGQLKRDYPANTRNVIAGGLAGNAFVSSSSDAYVSPITATSACGKNYVIVISNGLPQAGADSGNPNSSTLLQNVGGAPAVATIPLSNNVAQGNIGDEYTRFLYNSDVSPVDGQQNIITYTIFVYDPTHVTGNDAANLVLLNSMANQGHGKFFAATDVASLVNALNAIFNEVQSVNDVFAAVTLPINVNVRGTSLNQVYMGVFRPDVDALPKWQGNLKEYKLIMQNGVPVLGDATSQPAENSSTGFISPNATSYWTSTSTYWNFAPSGTPASGSDSPDGAVVEKGAAAQRLRSTYAATQAARNLYTCTSCTSQALSLTPFDATTLSPSSASVQTAFGATNAGYANSNTGTTGQAGEVTDIINWVRGADNRSDENVDGAYTDIRASIHGDVVHSRPAVINYIRTGTCAAVDANDTFVFYGANDGVFHAVRGGQGATDGAEQWGFVIPEFIPKLKRLRDNAPSVTLNRLPPADTSANRPYFADGAVSVYQLDANGDCKYTTGTSGDKIYLFVTMRRGGTFLYAIDVTDPATPKMMWKIAQGANYPDLGYTWSTPAVANVNLGGTKTPVLVFGAGYDPAVEDLDPQYVTAFTAASVTTTAGGGTTTNRTLGRRLYVVKISDGSVVWTAGPGAGPASVPSQTVSGMDYAFPSDPTVLDTNGDGYDDRFYIGDTGGNVWRVDISSSSPTHWNALEFASIDSSTTHARRKFLFPPTVVAGKDPTGSFHAVMIGSGDREHPFDQTIANRYYMFKDRAIGLVSSQTTPYTEADLFDATSAPPDDPNQGWYVTLATGEKVVSSSTALAGSVFFNTNIPPVATPGTCSSNLGTAQLYALDYLSAQPTLFRNAEMTDYVRSRTYAGGGLPPSPVPAVVNVDGHTEQVVITGTSVTEVPGMPLGTRTRTYWYEAIDQ